MECNVSIDFQVIGKQLGSDGRIEMIRNVVYEEDE